MKAPEDRATPSPQKKRSDPVKPEPTKPAPAKPEPTKPEPAKPEPTKPEPAKPEPAKPEPPAEETFETDKSTPEPDRDLLAPPAVPRLVPDTEHGDDHLGVESEARAFARIIASRRTGTPLSIGLFGAWGSGKSFFMEQLHRQVDARTAAFSRMARHLSERGESEARADLEARWHGRIAQITFNAWHYAEPNLLASLVTRVFDALAEVLSPEESVDDTRARLLAEVSEGKQRREHAQRELRRAEEQLVKARIEREQRQSELVDLRKELDVVNAVDPDGASSSAEPPPPTQPPSKAADTLKVGGPISALRITVRWVWSRGRWTRVTLIAGVLLVACGLLLLLARSRGWMDERSRELAILTATLGVLSTVGSTVSAWVARIKPRLDAAKKAHQQYKAGRETFGAFMGRAISDLVGPFEGAAALARRRFDAAQAELDSARVASEEATEQVARARRTLQQLDGGHRFYSFVTDRDDSDDYRQHLGLVSLVRDDFAKLEQILAQVERERERGEDGTGRGPGPISRIVLYIDDLDRCEPERVVEVLQAVHLLLATPIFVVVVAVDVRWLHRSLTLYYDRLLKTPGATDPGPDDLGRPTSKHYLEKIFQLPFCLRPMRAEGFSALVSGLTQPPVEDRSVAAPDPEDELRSLGHALLSDAVVSLTGAEIAFMQTLHGVIDTPRLAKSLVNTYRLLRAELSEPELRPYLDREHYRHVLTLLAIQVGRSAEAAVLFDAIDDPQDHPLFPGRPPSLGALVEALRSKLEPKERWQDLREVLTETHVDTLELVGLRPWTQRIRRFSFSPWSGRGTAL